MGLWTKKQRELGKAWVKDNAANILKSYADGYSILAIQRQAPIKVGRDLIETVLKNNGMILRGFSITSKTKQIREETNLKKFGVKNPSSCAAVKKTREQTNIERFGVKNTFQNLQIKEKIKQTNIKKYGHQNPASQCKKNVRISNVHRILSDALTVAEIEHHNEFLVISGSDKRAPRIDILINNTLGVEVYGDYFHANPKFYPADYKIKRFGGFKTAAEIWNEDKSRIESLNHKGLEILIFWEHDIKTNLCEVVRRIKDACNRNQTN